MRNEPYPGMGNVSKAEGLYLQKTKRKKKLYKPKPTSIEKLVKKIESENYITSPRSYNYLTLRTRKGTREIILPNYSLKAEALIDLIFHNIAKAEKFGINKPKPEDIVKVEDFQIVCKDESLMPPDFGFVSYETKEIRKLLNVPYWTDKAIIKASEELTQTIKAKNVKIYVEEDGKYGKEVDWLGSICSDIVISRTDRIAPRTKNIQHKIDFKIGLIAGLLFYNDAIRRRFSLFPTKLKNRLFYRTKRGIQKLYRYLSLWNYTALTFYMVCDLLRYSEKRNVTEVVNKVEGYLNEMKMMKLIKHWKRIGKGRSSVWQVFITKECREDFRQIARELQDEF